jgi:hypothetical protein
VGAEDLELICPVPTLALSELAKAVAAFARMPQGATTVVLGGIFTHDLEQLLAEDRHTRAMPRQTNMVAQLDVEDVQDPLTSDPWLGYLRPNDGAQKVPGVIIIEWNPRVIPAVEANLFQGLEIAARDPAAMGLLPGTVIIITQSPLSPSFAKGSDRSEFRVYQNKFVHLSLEG